jgi:hypothetical protein
MGDPYVSLASSTSSAIESASKHNLQCRVSTNHIIMWVQVRKLVASASCPV